MALCVLRDETRVTTGTMPTDRLFTGQRSLADLGIYFYNARFYDPGLARFLSADTMLPGAGNSQAYDRFAYSLGNPIKLTDPSGHKPLPPHHPQPKPNHDPEDFYNASNLGDLLGMGLQHADHANIVGEGLQRLQNDPHLKGVQDIIIGQIRNYPEYGNQSFNLTMQGPENFTADGGDNWFLDGFLSGDASSGFWTVHTGQISSTNVDVSADGTISTTWKVEDQFDYLPAWDDHSRPHYLVYNIAAQVIAPIYHGLLNADPFPTNAYWNSIYHPVKNSSSK
jgi:RHS repeat-associated protein